MKLVGGLFLALGFFLVAGTVGASDFYEECRAAADCVAGEPMSGLRAFIQILGGLISLFFGYVLVKD